MICSVRVDLFKPKEKEKKDKKIKEINGDRVNYDMFTVFALMKLKYALGIVF